MENISKPNKKNLITCNECGEVVEWKPGVPLDSSFVHECEKDEPKFTKCYSCRKKWAEKNLRCGQCNIQIGMHQHLWHNKMCEECFDSPD